MLRAANLTTRQIDGVVCIFPGGKREANSLDGARRCAKKNVVQVKLDVY
jgi:hypothetical protein